MHWLAVDTSMNACAVGVGRSDGAFFQDYQPMDRGQAERLMPMIESVIAQSGLSLQDIDAFAVTRGPGTFTGIRIALATVRALAHVSGKPAMGLITFDVLAAQARKSHPNRDLCILIETKRDDYYVQAPGMDGACMDGESLKAITQPGWLLVGDAVHRAKDALHLGNDILPIAVCDTGCMLDLAKAMPLVHTLPEPLYLRPADVSIARKKIAHIV